MELSSGRVRRSMHPHVALNVKKLLEEFLILSGGLCGGEVQGVHRPPPPPIDLATPLVSKTRWGVRASKGHTDQAGRQAMAKSGRAGPMLRCPVWLTHRLRDHRPLAAGPSTPPIVPTGHTRKPQSIRVSGSPTGPAPGQSAWNSRATPGGLSGQWAQLGTTPGAQLGPPTPVNATRASCESAEWGRCDCGCAVGSGRGARKGVHPRAPYIYNFSL
jgi:hypothetical protein